MMKKYKVLFFCCQLLLTVGHAQRSLPVIPEPRSVEVKEKIVSFNQVKVSINDTSLEGIKVELEHQFSEKFGIVFSEKNNRKTKKIDLNITKGIDTKEGYELEITKNHIEIAAATPHGIFNGIQTLTQLMYSASKDTKGNYLLNRVKIADTPRFGWRGFMLDESRHFFGKKKVKQLLDLMALHKLNTFHWHLTDEPGWRIEIKKYPKLTEIGAIGDYTNPITKPLFYSQEDIREIVAYAKARFIQVIPEIDMPGHASSAIRAYPELSGGGTKKHPNFTFNPGKEATYSFLTDVLKEVSELFEAPYIHIGGDEVHYGNQQWKTDASVKKLMQENGLKDIKEVERYFVNRMHDSIIALDKTLIGWDEVIQSKIDKNKSLIMWWRHDKREVLDEILNLEYPVVLCPRIPMYFDFLQHHSLKNGRHWGKNDFGDLEKVYNFPDALGIDFENSKIQGIQANLWSERYESEKSLDFALWPRVSALAEASWGASQTKNFESFKKRLKKMYAIYDSYGLYYFDIFNPSRNIEPKGAGKQNWQVNHLKN